MLQAPARGGTRRGPGRRDDPDPGDRRHRPVLSRTHFVVSRDRRFLKTFHAELRGSTVMNRVARPPGGSPLDAGRFDPVSAEASSTLPSSWYHEPDDLSPRARGDLLSRLGGTSAMCRMSPSPAISCAVPWPIRKSSSSAAAITKLRAFYNVCSHRAHPLLGRSRQQGVHHLPLSSMVLQHRRYVSHRGRTRNPRRLDPRKRRFEASAAGELRRLSVRQPGSRRRAADRTGAAAPEKLLYLLPAPGRPGARRAARTRRSRPTGRRSSTTTTNATTAMPTTSL